MTSEIVNPYKAMIESALKAETKAYDRYSSQRDRSMDRGNDYLTDRDREIFAAYEVAKRERVGLREHDQNFDELIRYTKKHLPSDTPIHLDFILAAVLASHRVGRDNPMLFAAETDLIASRLTTPEAIQSLYAEAAASGIFQQFTQRLPLRGSRGEASRLAAYNEALEWMGLDYEGLVLLGTKLDQVRSGKITAGELRQDYARRDLQKIEDWPVVLRMTHAAVDLDKVTEFADAARPYLDARKAAAKAVLKSAFAPAPQA